MKKAVLVAAAVLQLGLLAACSSNNSNSSSNKSDVARSSSLASLKRENKQLKAKSKKEANSQLRTRSVRKAIVLALMQAVLVLVRQYRLQAVHHKLNLLPPLQRVQPVKLPKVCVIL